MINLYDLQLSRKKITSIALIVAGAILVIVAVWFFATHGIVRITKTADSEYIYFNLGTETYADGAKSKSSFMIVSSGQYGIELKQDGNLIQKNFTVPSWLQSVEVTLPTPTQRSVERIAGGTLESIIKQGENIFSVAPNGLAGNQLLIHPANDPSGNASRVKLLEQSNDLGVVSNNQLIAFTGDGDVIQPIIYDKGIDANPSLITAPAGDTLPHVIASSSAGNQRFAISYNNADIQIFNGKDLIRSIVGLDNAGISADGYIVTAVSANFAAVGFGANSTDTVGDDHDEEVSTQPATDYLVKIYDIQSGDVTRTVNLGPEVNANSITVSDDGSRIAVEYDGRLNIYDTATSAKLFSFEGSTIKQAVWTSNSQLVFSDQVNGLLRYDDKERTVTTLFAPGELTINQFTISDNTLLFTASSGSGDVRTDLSGYALYLDREAINNNALITKLPYRDNDIKISTLNGIIYASPNAFVKPPDNSNVGLEFYEATLSNDVKQKIDNYIKNYIPNSSDYRIVYGYNL